MFVHGILTSSDTTHHPHNKMAISILKTSFFLIVLFSFSECMPRLKRQLDLNYTSSVRGSTDFTPPTVESFKKFIEMVKEVDPSVQSAVRGFMEFIRAFDTSSFEAPTSEITVENARDAFQDILESTTETMRFRFPRIEQNIKIINDSVTRNLDTLNRLEDLFVNQTIDSINFVRAARQNLQAVMHSAVLATMKAKANMFNPFVSLGLNAFNAMLKSGAFNPVLTSVVASNATNIESMSAEQLITLSKAAIENNPAFVS